jgi:hypothetical protein
MSLSVIFPPTYFHDPYRLGIVYPVEVDGRRFVCLLPDQILGLYPTTTPQGPSSPGEVFERYRWAIQKLTVQVLTVKGTPQSGELVISMDDVT